MLIKMIKYSKFWEKRANEQHFKNELSLPATRWPANSHEQPVRGGNNLIQRFGFGRAYPTAHKRIENVEMWILPSQD